MQYSHLFLLVSLLYTETALAYVGPGLGLGAIGAIIGVVVAILLAILGVFWYPLKRMLRKNKTAEALGEESDES